MEIFVNDIRVPFKGTVQLKFLNPLFNDIGSYSLPMTFPAKVPAVQKAFGFPSQLEAETPAYISGRIKAGKIDLIGSWKVTDTSTKEIEAYFRSGIGDFYSMIKDKLLTDLEFGGIKYPAGVGANAGTVLAYMTTKMNAVYPDDDWAAFLAYMPDTCDGSSMKVNAITHDAVTGIPRFATSATLNSTVYLFVGTVIDYIFEEFGYQIEENIFRKDTDLKQLVIFNTFNRVADDAFDYSRLLPRRTIADFLKAIRNRFNVGCFINEQNRSVKIISFNSIIQSGPSEEIICGKLTINKNKVSGISFPISAPDEWCAHEYGSLAELDPENTLVTVDIYEDIFIMIQDHPNDIIGKIVFVTAESNYYLVVSSTVVEKKCSGQFPYVAGDGSLEIEQFSGIPANYTLEKNFETLVEYVIPRCDLKSNRNGYEFTDYPLMFTFARGVQDCFVFPVYNAFARQYPEGSNDIYDANGDAISGASLSLKWQGNSGVIEKFWQNRLTWELYIKKIIKLDFTGSELNKLIDFSKIVRINESNCIINSLNVELSNKTTVIKESELFRV
jgi:hypothetical protein